MEDYKAERQARQKVDKLRREFRDDSIRCGYKTMNTGDKHWGFHRREVEKHDDINFIDVEKPIYFKITDKQYFFDPDNAGKLKKHLERGLTELLEGAESLIDAINDLNIKTANTDGERLFVERKIKIRELMVKSGKID